MLKTGAEIAKLRGVTRGAVTLYIQEKAIQPSGMKGKLKTYDVEAEPLASYLAAGFARANRPPPGPALPSLVPEVKPAPSKRKADAPAASSKIPKPLNDLLAGRLPSGRKPSAEFYLKALAIAESNKDAALLFKLGQMADKEDKDELYQLQMLKTEQAKEQMALEKADRMKLENDIRPGQFMDKAAVKLVFGQIYAVDSSVLMPLGLKLADMINALPPGPDRRNKIQELIDNEIYAALESKKRLLADFIQAGGEGDRVDE